MINQQDFSSIPPDLLADAFEALAEGIAIYDSDERLVLFNQRYKELLGPMADMIRPGMHWRDLIHGCVERGVVAERHESGEDWVTVSAGDRDSRAKGSEIRQLNGRYFELSYQPTRTGGFVVTRADVTDRVRAEKAAASHAELLQKILDTTPSPLIMSRLEDGKILYRSSAADELLSEAEYTTEISAIPGDRDRYVETLKEKGKVENWETRSRRRGGGELALSISGALTEFEGETCIVTCFTDLTERIERDALLSTILDTNPAPVVMARLTDSKILYRSRAAEEMFNDVEYAVDMYVDADERKQYLDAMMESGKVESMVVKGHRRGGGEVTVAMSGALTEFNGETYVVTCLTDLTERVEREEMMRQVVEACPAPVLMNRAATGEILYRSPELIALLGDGMDAKDFYVDQADRAGFLTALRDTGEVSDYREKLYNADGKPFWAAVSGRLTEWDGEEVLVTFTRDLTQQLAIEAELDRQREQMFQTEKMSALGSLLAGVAHELNNPLSVVVGHAMMLQEEASDENTLRQTRKISDAAERCARIVKTFLAMARQEPSRMDAVDLNEVVETAVEVARYGDNPNSVRIEVEAAPDLPGFTGDADQLTQVVVNLILNAEQAINSVDKGDTVRLTTWVSQGTLKLAVEDNGPGVPADIRKRVFEPFFTTKGLGEGTGIGLSISHRIIAAHGGEIVIEDVPTGGARFVVTLPAPVDTATDTPAPVAEPGKDATTCRILVIDDEEDVADLNAEVLSRHGFVAQAAYSVDSALKLIEDATFDVVLSDLNMPGKDGRDLFETVRDTNPDLADRIGFITGDTLGRTSQKFLAEANRPYLEKPVSPKELREFVSRLGQGCAK